MSRHQQIVLDLSCLSCVIACTALFVFVNFRTKNMKNNRIMHLRGSNLIFHKAGEQLAWEGTR